MSKSKQTIDRVVHATQRICTIPPVPTQDWAAQIASAIACSAPSSVVGVVVANLDAESLSISPISTGVSQSPTQAGVPPTGQSQSGQPQSGQSQSGQSQAGQPQSSPGDGRGATKNNQSFYLQDKLERISALGLPIPPLSIEQGLVAPLSLLQQNWQGSQLGRILAANHLVSPILAVVPINRDHPGFVLLIVVAFEQEPGVRAPGPESAAAKPASGPGPEASRGAVDQISEIIAALVPPLSQRANMALKQVTNPKAWLTDREHEILEQLILGHSVRVIAEKLGRSVHTVHDHVKNLHKKLDASSRGELIAKALGYTPSNQPRTVPAPSPLLLSGASMISELKPGTKAAGQGNGHGGGQSDGKAGGQTGAQTSAQISAQPNRATPANPASASEPKRLQHTKASPLPRRDNQS